MALGNVLISGASSGIGRACAIHLAGLGYKVRAGVRNPAAGEDLQALGLGIEPILLDVTDPDSISRAVHSVEDAPLAGLINNAGVSVIGPIEMVPVEEWRRQYEVNVFGLVAVTQAFLPCLRRGKGRIVNIGSIAGRSALPGTAAYDSSKFALEGITDSLRMELRPFGINVSIVEPGSVATAIWEKTLRGSDELAANPDPELAAMYGPLIAGIRKEAEKAAGKGLPPEVVAKAVQHALTARRPKTRYVVGRDARFFLLLNLLPDKWRDWLILSQLNG